MAALRILLCVALCLNVSVLTAAEGFEDDFSNPDPTNLSRQPVTWRHINGAELSIDNGSLKLSRDAGTPWASVVDFNAVDLAVETQFRLLDGTSGGIALRTGDSFSPCYYGALSSSNLRTSIGRCGNITISDFVDVDFDVAQVDAKLRLEIVGDELALWAWPADEPMPIEPTVTTVDMPGPNFGSVGIWAGNGEGDLVQAEFRYFNATIIPEPGTAVLSLLGCLSLLPLRRKR